MTFPNPFRSKPPAPKRLDAKDLEFGFKDNQNRSYYLINTQLGIGLEHYGKAMEFTMFMAAGLHPTEIKKLTTLGKSTCEDAAKGKKGALATLGWIFEEMELREELVIHTELLYNFIACYYIREDEPLTHWVESIHNEKVEAFKDCVKTRTAYEFFQLPVLKNIAGISSMSPDEWNTHWNASVREQKNLQKKIDYLTSELKSAPVPRTSRRVS